MPCVREYNRNGNGWVVLFIFQQSAVFLYNRFSGCHQMRCASYAVCVRAILPMRRYGSNGRCIARHWQFHIAYVYIHYRRLRFSDCLDLYHIPGSPVSYGAMFVFLLSGILDSYPHCPLYYFLNHIQSKKTEIPKTASGECFISLLTIIL